MAEGRPGPGRFVVVVFVALLSFALVTTMAVVALGVGPIAAVVPESPDAVPEQPGDTVAGDGANATVEGTVSGPDGEPAGSATVALAPHPEPLFAKATPSELADVLNAETADDFHVARTDADGSFAATVPPGEYDVVAVRDGNVSQIGTVNATAAGGGSASANASVALSITDERPLTYRTSAGTAEPDGNVTVTAAVYNNDADTENLTVSFTGVPAGWTVTGSGGNAVAVDEASRSFRFENVSSGEWARAELTLRAPADARRGTTETVSVRVTARGDDANGTVEVRWRGSATVRVPSNETTAATSVPGGDEGSNATATTDGPVGSAGAGGDLADFAVALAAAAVALVVVAVLTVGHRE